MRTPFILVLFLVSGIPAHPDAETPTAGVPPMHTIEARLGAQATLSFQMRPDRAYRNGQGQDNITCELLEIPGLARCFFQQNSGVCSFNWVWDKAIEADGLNVNLPELPYPDTYHIQYTWDIAAGRFDGYINGVPLRLPNTDLPSWTQPETDRIHIADGPFQVTDLAVEPRYIDDREARGRTPESLRDKHARLFGVVSEQTPLDAAALRGDLLYRSDLNEASAVNGWIVEGPGKLSFHDGWMEMASERPDGPEGHIVHWCPVDFPESFVARWEIAPVSHYGLCIVFFAARGQNGEDIFAPHLPERTGIFTQYTKGAIHCYHLSYYANTPFNAGRITCNMRKNSGFYLVTNGPPGIPPGSRGPHLIDLIKDGPRTQLQVDGRVIIDFTDNGEQYGPVHGGGKIGLRQMQWMVARYRNFRVWSLR